jgi:acyl carrier protein
LVWEEIPVQQWRDMARIELSPDGVMARSANPIGPGQTVRRGKDIMSTFDSVRKVIMDRLRVEENEVTEETKVVEDLGADELDVVDITMGLEEEFEIEISDEDAEKLLAEGRTVADIVAYVDAHK